MIHYIIAGIMIAVLIRSIVNHYWYNDSFWWHNVQDKEKMP